MQHPTNPPSPADLGAVLDLAGEALLCLDESARIVAANQAGCALLECSPQDLQRTPLALTDLAPLTVQEQLRLAMRQARHSGTHLPLGFMLRDRPVRWCFLPMADPGRHLAVVTDLAPLQAEHLVTERYFRILVDELCEGILVIDIHGVACDVNAGYTRLTGYDPEETMGTVHRHKTVLPEDEPARQEAFRAALDGTTSTVELRLRHRQGHLIPVRARYHPLPRLADWSTDRILITFVDLGEQKAAQERLETLLEHLRHAMEKTAAALVRLGDGDLVTGLHGLLEGELAPVAAHLENLRQRYATALCAVETATGVVLDALHGLSAGQERLTERTEHQATGLAQVASSLDELSTGLNHSATHMQKTSETAESMRQASEEGAMIMQQATAAMERINETEARIAEIITVIDEIAFQTNLLALNAAVEAARAGEHGRGFAVVAAEVRALSQRSSSSAREIKQLLALSAQRVADGNRLTIQSERSFQQIHDAVHTVSGLVHAISAAIAEQSRALVQVATTVEEINNTTQENAALVERQTTATHTVLDQTTDLVRMLGFFTLPRNTPGEDTPQAIAAQLARPQRQTVAPPVAGPPVLHNPAAPGDWNDF